MNDVAKKLCELSAAPTQKDAFDKWLAQEDALKFLADNAEEQVFVVYAGVMHTFIHAIFVPAALVDPPDVEDLMAWNFNASSSWGVSITFSESPKVSLSPPLEHTGSKTLNAGEQFVFARHFEGRLGNNSNIEILQKLIHVSGLHFLPDRNAYCRLDKHGDIEEAVRIIRIPGKGDDFDGTIVTFDRRLLDKYMALTDAVIVRTFDFTRHRPSQFGGWSGAHERKYVTEGDVFFRLVSEPSHASFMRGCQIVRPMVSKEEILKRLARGGEEEEKRYVSFIAHDWKNRIVTEISCTPGHTANYFTESDLPFEMSPAFFRPEVLSKYKADSEKYQLDSRSISCRGAWHLQTYDINEAGQVHTYLVYLRNLPYEEQLYWKAYNEHPKGPISKRAIATDFEGKWELEYDPLNSVKHAVRRLHKADVPWWKLRSDQLLNKVHYPVTTSSDEWANELHYLDQLIVEGFEERWLRRKVKSLGRTPDPKFGSLKLMEQYLIALGVEEDRAQRLIVPFQELHFLRTKLKGHAAGQEAAEIRRKKISDYGSYKKHFEALCTECDESFRTIIEILIDRTNKGN